MHFDIELTMISKDGHIYKFIMTVSEIETIAFIKKRAKNHMISKDWEHFGYELKRIELC